MTLKNLLVLSIFIQVAVISATPRFYQSSKLAIRAPSPASAPGVPALTPGIENDDSSPDSKAHPAPADSSSGALKAHPTSADSSPGAPKALDSSSASSKQSPKVTTSRVTNDFVQTNSTSSEESTGDKSGAGAQVTPIKGSSTVVTDKVSHATVKTNLTPDESSTREANSNEKPSADAAATPKPGDSAKTLKATDSTATSPAGDAATASKAGDASPTMKAAEAPPTSKAGEAAQTPKAGEAAQTPKAGEAAQAPKAGEAAQTPKAGEAAQAPKTGEAAQAPKTGEAAQAPKAGEAAQTPKAAGAAAAPKTSDATSTPKNQDSKPSPTSDEAAPKPADAQANPHGAAATTKSADANAHGTAESSSTVPKAINIEVGKPSAASEGSQGEHDSGHHGSLAAPEAGSPNSIEVSVSKKSAAPDDPHGASVTQTTDGARQGMTAKTIDGTPDNLKAPSDGPQSQASASPKSDNSAHGTNPTSGAPVTAKTIDINVGKANPTLDEHSSAPKQKDDTDAKTSLAGGSADASSPKVVQVNIGKPNSNQADSAHPADTTHQAPEGATGSAKSQQSHNAESTTSFDAPSPWKLENKSVVVPPESATTLTATDQPVDKQIKPAEKSKPKDSDDAFPSNLTSLVNEPPTNNEKNNALLSHPQSMFTLLSTSILAGLLVLVA